MPERGRLTEWNDDRGFGFITPLDGEGRIFVHVREFPRDKRRPLALDLVTYDLAHDERGRLGAVHVDYLGPTEFAPHRSNERQEPSNLSAIEIAAAGLFFVALIAVVAAGRVPRLALGLYGGMSALLFLTYGADKWAAQNHQWRTSEATLHLLALAGGWPGALIARLVFRHKTRKQPFRLIFWCTVVVNCGVLALVVAAGGAPG